MTTQNQEPNQFELEGDGVRISYHAGQFIDEPTLPQFTYQAAGETLVFHKGEIRTEEAEGSQLGTLVSVTIRKTIDAGETVLVLLLPSINLAGQQEQSFDTLAIVTQSFGILPHKGARLTYKAYNLSGTARLVPLL